MVAEKPPTLLTGDVDRLPDALDLVPDGATPVVMHTALLPYAGEARRTEFVERVRPWRTPPRTADGSTGCQSAADPFLSRP